MGELIRAGISSQIILVEVYSAEYSVIIIPSPCDNDLLPLPTHKKTVLFISVFTPNSMPQSFERPQLNSPLISSDGRHWSLFK